MPSDDKCTKQNHNLSLSMEGLLMMARMLRALGFTGKEWRASNVSLDRAFSTEKLSRSCNAKALEHDKEGRYPRPVTLDLRVLYQESRKEASEGITVSWFFSCTVWGQDLSGGARLPKVVVPLDADVATADMIILKGAQAAYADLLGAIQKKTAKMLSDAGGELSYEASPEVE